MNKITKNLDILMTLDKKTYAIDPKCYMGTKVNKTQIILGGSLRKDSNYIKHLKIKDNGQTKRWCTFTITRDGKVYEHYDPQNLYTDYMGVKEIDKKSISIILENMGMLYFDNAREAFVNWIDEMCDEKLVYERQWKNYRYWEKYSDQQYDALANLCSTLCKEHKINLDCVGHNVFDPDAVDFKGIVTRSNIDSDYTDLNPSFDYQKFLKMLNISME